MIVDPPEPKPSLDTWRQRLVTAMHVVLRRPKEQQSEAIGAYATLMAFDIYDATIAERVEVVNDYSALIRLIAATSDTRLASALSNLSRYRRVVYAQDRFVITCVETSDGPKQNYDVCHPFNKRPSLLVWELNRAELVTRCKHLTDDERKQLIANLS